MAALLEEMVNCAYHMTWWIDCAPNRVDSFSHRWYFLLTQDTNTSAPAEMSSKITLLNEMERLSLQAPRTSQRPILYSSLSLVHTLAHCSPSCAVLRSPSGLVKSRQLLLLLGFSPLLIHHLSLCVSLALLLSVWNIKPLFPNISFKLRFQSFVMPSEHCLTPARPPHQYSVTALTYLTLTPSPLPVATRILMIAAVWASAWHISHQRLCLFICTTGLLETCH